MDRRRLLKFGLALAAGVPLSLSGTGRALASLAGSDGQDFSARWLREHARALAAKPYRAPQKPLPPRLQSLDWDQYQAIRYRPDQALWRHRDSAFQLQFFHLGLFFQEPVHFYEVADGKAHALPYQNENFDYGGSDVFDDLPDSLGYAGFRVHFHQDFSRDIAAFLGASYFRAVGESRQYGLSARGLAVNTGLPQPEEFPRFTTFWLERPGEGDLSLTVHALLDSPSVTGAYRFVIHPGANLTMDVEATIYPRKTLERFGLAPLTSMYQTGENDRRMANDWRPEIHDSDGLAIWTGNGERIWRPLTNPQQLTVSHFVDNQPRGFGLLQRDRDFSNYQDDGVFYDQRPSLWVTPRDDWGKGAVLLVEIPTLDETFDNIVAFWNPAEPWQPGEAYPVSYRLSWGETMPDQNPELGTVVATRTGIGGVIGQPRTYFSRRFAVDFAGGSLSMMDRHAGVEAVVSASRGKVELVSARPLHAINGFRAMFDLVPDDDTSPIDLRLYLRLGPQALTETWLYQYTPPPPEARSL
ncbi:glucans biosynthesis protein [Marinobacter sp. MBR-99]|jgi:glucans biosynthesis protein|uniref:glucan biosynthesis protein n=1 Tax=Marinobacter sp. MBR-99 TaxID=3156461 RepID=UPI0033997E52